MQVVEFVHETKASDIPDNVRNIARYWLLDLLGVGASGTQTPLSKIIREHACDHFAAGRQSARLLFDGRTVSPAGAALAGASTIDSVDAHDGYRPCKGHVGCPLLAALLALSDAQPSLSEEEFLTSLVIGYELGSRAGTALHATVSDYHTTGAWMAAVCAAMGSRMLDLSATTTRHAMGIAEYHAPRSQMMRCIDDPTMVKDGSGMGAMAGVSGAYLAKSGFTGAPAIVMESDETKTFFADLGSTWLTLDQYYKPFPVCRWAQPPVCASLELMKEHQLTAKDIKEVEVHTFHQSVRLAVREPKTTEEAQYSTSYPTAAAIVRGTVGYREISPESFNDPEILRLSKSMKFVECDDYNEAFPAKRRAHVTLNLMDGRSLSSPPTDAWGDPENPPSHEDFVQKFHELSRPVLGTGRATAIEEAVLNFGSAGKSIERLLDLTLTHGIINEAAA